MNMEKKVMLTFAVAQCLIFALQLIIAMSRIMQGNYFMGNIMLALSIIPAAGFAFVILTYKPSSK